MSRVPSAAAVGNHRTGRCFAASAVLGCSSSVILGGLVVAIGGRSGISFVCFGVLALGRFRIFAASHRSTKLEEENAMIGLDLGGSVLGMCSFKRSTLRAQFTHLNTAKSTQTRESGVRSETARDDLAERMSKTKQNRPQFNALCQLRGSIEKSAFNFA